MYEHFDDFDRDNPDIWALFRSTTFEVMERGFKHYGANSILERIRWHTSIEQGQRDFKINNNWAPFYARKFMEIYPVYAGFFRTRVQKSGTETISEAYQ